MQLKKIVSKNVAIQLASILFQRRHKKGFI
jgi:hypothetical protein